MLVLLFYYVEHAVDLYSLHFETNVFIQIFSLYYYYFTCII